MRLKAAAIISICLVAVVLGCACISPYGDGTTTIPGTGEVPPRTLIGITHPGPGERTYTFSFLLDKKIINQREPAAVNITIGNLIDRPLTIRPFPPGLRVVDSCRSIVRTIPSGTGDRVIPPGETLVSALSWDMRDDQGVPLPPGRYRVELFWEEEQLPSFNYTMGPPPPIPTGTGDIIIPEWGLGPLVVRYPEGALERVIEVNRTLTVAGLPVTLERVECTEEDILASFLYPIPSGTLPPGTLTATIPPPPPDTGPGIFRIDGGPECSFRTMPVTQVDGLWRVEGDLPPVSKNARNLTLIVPELAGQNGPWAFEVRLD